MSEQINDCILVCFDSNYPDSKVLVVGRKRPNKSVEIINAFQGEEAEDLYLKLTTPVKKVQYE